MNLFRLLDLFLAGGLLCGAGLLLALIVAFVYAAVRERGGNGRLILFLFLVIMALSACGTLRLEVLPPTTVSTDVVADAFRTATPGPATATRQRVNHVGQQATATARPATATSTATATPAGPLFSDVFFCLEPCAEDGSNSRATFPGGIDTLYIHWTYEDVPAGAHYQRLWRSRGEQWVIYDCTWPGPSTGEEMVSLTEPDGLRSGRWEMIIRVEGKELVREAITLTGDHDYWYPAGSFDTCYGKKTSESTPIPLPTATSAPPRPTNTSLPPPPPTATPTITPTATPTPFPVVIDNFAVTAVESLAQGKRISFAWEATGREAQIRAETKVSLNPTWTVPLSGTLTIEVVESVYREPSFVLEVSDADPISPNIVTAAVQVAWQCPYAYFFEPAPDVCPDGPAIQTRIAYQPFERGHMIWRENRDDIFVFYDDGTWQNFSNLFQPDGIAEEPEQPPDGLFRPVRGFGLVWEEQVGVRERLGWATAPEGARTLAYQEQIPLSERLLPTYWQVAGEEVLLLTSHGGLSGDWQQFTARQPAATGGVLPH